MSVNYENRRVRQARLRDNAPEEIIKVYKNVVNIAHEVALNIQSYYEYRDKHNTLVCLVELIPAFGIVESKVIKRNQNG